MTLRLQTYSKSSTFLGIVAFSFLFYLVEYFLLTLDDWHSEFLPIVVDIAVFTTITVSYIYIYRRNCILCFELMFFPVFFCGIFYNNIIYGIMNYDSGEGVGGALLNAVSEPTYILKSKIVQMVAFTAFVLGCIWGSHLKTKLRKEWDCYKVMGREINFVIIEYIVLFLLSLILVLNYYSGDFDTWAAYEKGLSDTERNQGLGNIYTLCDLATLSEFCRLSKKGIKSFRQFVEHCNKLYVTEIIGVSALLFFTGNRNEMLLIFLPMIIAYSIFICKIKVRYVIIGILLGITMMIYSGLTRFGNSFNYNELDVYTMTRDYSLVSLDCTYLIKYTDNYGTHHFESLPASIIGGIPFLGHRIIGAMGWTMENQSPYITTAGMAQYTNTGLGTSLVGDLYYNAKLPFVIIFMIVWGYMISRLHIRFVFEKRYSAPLLFIYLYMTANAVYFIRQQWDFPIHCILYEIIILFIIAIFIGKKLINNRLYTK